MDILEDTRNVLEDADYKEINSSVGVFIGLATKKSNHFAIITEGIRLYMKWNKI